MRETGIFTGTTNSPSRSLRQSHDRYAIRAGRNLPDKEFRLESMLLISLVLLFEIKVIKLITLHVAMQLGLYLHQPSCWRLALSL